MTNILQQISVWEVKMSLNETVSANFKIVKFAFINSTETHEKKEKKKPHQIQNLKIWKKEERGIKTINYRVYLFNKQKLIIPSNEA